MWLTMSGLARRFDGALCGMTSVVGGAGPRAARVAAHAARPDRVARGRLAAVGADGEHREQLLKIFPFTRRTRGRTPIARQVLEVVSASPAFVFEKWHRLS